MTSDSDSIPSAIKANDQKIAFDVNSPLFKLRKEVIFAVKLLGIETLRVIPFCVKQSLWHTEIQKLQSYAIDAISRKGGCPQRCIFLHRNHCGPVAPVGDI